MSKPNPLTPDEAKKRIRLILKNGRVKLSLHCRFESMPRRGVDYQDVVNVLSTGSIVRTPEWSDAHQQWKYLVEGVDLEGDDLTTVTVIVEADLTLIIVTVF